jgi:cytochrome c oxidase subunit IV
MNIVCVCVCVCVCVNAIFMQDNWDKNTSAVIYAIFIPLYVTIIT